MANVDLTAVKANMGDPSWIHRYLFGDVDTGRPGMFTPKDPPYLTDILLQWKNGGLFVLEALAKWDKRYNRTEKEMLWTLRVTRDDWGNPAHEGMIVKRKIHRERKTPDGSMVGSNDLTIDRQRGVYDQKWTDTREFKLDKKGCFKCTYHDAVYFLRTYGINERSGTPISYHTTPHTGDPVKAPNGDMIHVWYHRYSEVDNEMYQALPRVPSLKGAILRGITTKDEREKIEAAEKAKTEAAEATSKGRPQA